MCVFVCSEKLCPTICHTMDCSPPGSSVHGVFQARILLQGIRLTQGSNPQLLRLLRWQMGSLPQCRLGSPGLGIFCSKQSSKPEKMLRGVHAFRIHSGDVMRREILEGEKSSTPVFALDMCTWVCDRDSGSVTFFFLDYCPVWEKTGRNSCGMWCL